MCVDKECNKTNYNEMKYKFLKALEKLALESLIKHSLKKIFSVS